MTKLAPEWVRTLYMFVLQLVYTRGNMCRSYLYMYIHIYPNYLPELFDLLFESVLINLISKTNELSSFSLALLRRNQ